MPKFDSSMWRELLAYLRQRHTPICRQWFEQLEPCEIQSGLLRIRTVNSVQQRYLQRRCLEPFTEAAQTVTGALVAVRFVSDELIEPSVHAAYAGPRGESSTVFAESAHDHPGAAHDAAWWLDQTIISPDHTFETFVTGPCNQLAYAASVAVANQPAAHYNPLFIHGGVGLGKTHLLEAIGQRVLTSHPQSRMCYLSCDNFMNQFLDCVQQGKMTRFRETFRHVDLLIIDDIHFLANRERTQEEFFHTFNAIYQSNRQIVLSSDSPPEEIPQLEKRLTSRFQWGLVTHVGKPCYDTRVAIAKTKASLRGLTLPDDVLQFIADRSESSVRELEGAITTIHGSATLQDKTIDLDLAHQALGQLAADHVTPYVSLQDIIDAVTHFYGVRLSDLQSKRRHKSITGPRQLCMWLARQHTRFSLEEIGGYFGGRDHTTVMHSVKITQKRLLEDQAFNREVDRINALIEQSLRRPPG